MVQKRPFDEDLYEGSCKLPKQSKHDEAQSLFSEIIKSEYASDIDTTGGKSKYEMEERYTNLTGDPLHKPFFPEFFFPERTVRTVPRHEDMYSLLLHHPPQKPVPLGLDHQAEIPPWNPSKVRDEDDELSGTTIIPMPDLEPSECKVRTGRAECCCGDKGSVRCVRKHVVEARDKLEKTVGRDAFEELGFLEMGEAVTEQWTEDEERFFHHFVFSNPISTGKSFWSGLSSAFPSRTKREIVSYYFNVFVLRMRAEQNRFDPMNVDSDNDEWCLSDEEDDDDSVVEYPLHRVDEYDEDAAGKSWAAADGKNGSEDSCTSFDSEAVVPGPHPKDDSVSRDRWSAGLNHDCMWDPCGDEKLWDDVGYMTCRKREADFLPTCSMIEEVFGDDSWNFKVDGKGLL